MIWIFLLVLLNIFHPTSCASCCNDGNSENISSEDQHDQFVRGVNALDRLHRFWFQRRILDALHIPQPPAEASVWRRRRDQQRRSISSSEQTISDGQTENQDLVRRYTLRIIGILESHQSSRVHHRRHNNDHQRRGADGNSECSSSVHYSFYSKIPLSSSASQNQEYETELEKAELEISNLNDTLANSDPTETTIHGWSPFHPVQGRDGGGELGWNESVYVSDVTQELRQFWSNTDGANITVSLVRRNENNGAGCLRSAPHHHHPRRHSIESASPLILKLTLMEKSIQRAHSKRSIPASLVNPRSNGTGRRMNRQLIIEDCENQWDSAFLRETVGQYDDLMPCCRRRVHIDFHELGWGSWVVSPASFDSYYCMGRCTNFGGFASADTDGAAFYTEAMNLYRDARNSGLTPCCSPVKFSPLTITVLIGDNEEMTQTLEDVVVKQCGCM